MSQSTAEANGPDPGDDFLESDATVVGSPASVTPAEYPKGLTSRELAHALRGEMLDHFYLQQFIGGGGMGVVFKALDTTLDRIVAVKVVASHRVDADDLQRRFLVEAQSTARLDHPNIARIHYIGRDRGLPYIVFEYIDGSNVRDVIAEQGPLEVAEALSYCYQIAHALAHAWDREVVHRDIKPSNIIVTADGQAKLVDMGLARLQVEDAQEEDLTATGITLGTFDYISPEQARDPRLADCRSDIYSLGCTLYFMLAGQAPFSQGTAVQKLLQHQDEPAPDPRDARPDVPDGVAALIKRMLAKSPEDRQQTPDELVGDLAALLTDMGMQLSQSLPPIPFRAARPRQQSWRRHAAWLAPVAILVALGWWIDRMDRDDETAPPFAPLISYPTSTDAAKPPQASSATAPAQVPEPHLPPPASQPMTAFAPSTTAPRIPYSLAPSASASSDIAVRPSLWETLLRWPAETPPALTTELSNEASPATAEPLNSSLDNFLQLPGAAENPLDRMFEEPPAHPSKLDTPQAAEENHALP